MFISFSQLERKNAERPSDFTSWRIVNKAQIPVNLCRCFFGLFCVVLWSRIACLDCWELDYKWFCCSLNISVAVQVVYHCHSSNNLVHFFDAFINFCFNLKFVSMSYSFKVRLQNFNNSLFHWVVNIFAFCTTCFSLRLYLVAL